MTETEITAFKTRTQDWLMKLELGKWYSIPKTNNPELFLKTVEYCIDVLDPYLLSEDKTMVCNISEYRTAHWKEFKDLKPLEWFKINGRADYTILVANFKFFIDVKLPGQFSNDYKKFQWLSF